jgi:hypothetical protein
VERDEDRHAATRYTWICSVSARNFHAISGPSIVFASASAFRSMALSGDSTSSSLGLAADALKHRILHVRN